MGSAIVTSGKDSWVGSGNPNRTHHKAPRLRLAQDSALAYVFLKSPVPRGSTVVSATLQLYIAGSYSGAKTFKARRVASRFDWSDLTWNNRPGVTGASQPTATITGGTDGQLVELDVTNHLQTVANGSRHYGWRIETDSSTAHRIYSFDSDNPPRLLVVHSGPPGTPTDLAPAGVVSVAKPVLTFTAPDLTGEDDIAALRIWIDPTAPGSSPAFDSGEIATTVPELDLTTTAYAGLADGGTTQWKVRWKNSAGVWSDWSDWATFSRVNKPALTITTPSGLETVTTVTPPLEATLGSGTLKAWMIRIVDPNDPSRIIAESGKRQATGNTFSWTPPKRVLQDDTTYQARFFAWDDVARVATPGDPRYILAARNFFVDDDAAVTAPVLTAVDDSTALPVMQLTFTRSVAPDSFTVYRDGKVVDADVDPDDITIGTGTYRWTDYDASWMEPHTYAVRAVASGVQSPKSNTITETLTPSDVWIMDPDRGLSFMLSGIGIDNWERIDQAGEYEVLGADYAVVIKAGSSGYRGAFQGSLRAAHGRTITSLRADLAAIQAKRVRPVLLRAANLSIPVILLDLSCLPHPETSELGPRDLVKFRFREAPAVEDA